MKISAAAKTGFDGALVEAVEHALRATGYPAFRDIQIEIENIVIPFPFQIDTYSTVPDIVVNAHYKCCVSNVLHF